MPTPRSGPEASAENGASAPGRGARARAYAVHVLTASGVLFAFLAAAEICTMRCDPRWVFVWLALAALVDAVDGPLARRWDVKTLASRFDGRTIDDILDYLTFTFLPLLLIWRMGWVPFASSTGSGATGPSPSLLAGVWIAPAMLVSLLGFANVAIKQEEAGFFEGFPSYWNIVAFYAGLLFVRVGPWPNALMIVVLTVMTLAPVRLVYPNRAPAPWKTPVLIAAALWLILLLATLPWYPHIPSWVFWLSVAALAAYVLLSVYLDRTARRRTTTSL